MRARTKVFGPFGALAATLALPSCSFLLDFDALQKDSGRGGAANGGTSAGSSGASSGGTSSGGLAGGGAQSGGESAFGGAAGGGQGGEGQAGESSGGASEAGAGAGGGGVACDCLDTDNDPCTVARCVDLGRGPECVQQPREGLVLDREFESVLAERFADIELVAGPSEFYLSTLSTTGTSANAIVYRFSATNTSVVPVLDLASLKVAGPPASLPALAVDTTNGVRIHAFAALRQVGGGGGARVWHLALDADFKVQNRALVSADYALGASVLTQSQQPAALTLGDETWGAWINADGTIALTSVGANPDTITFGTPGQATSTVSLLATRTGRPATLYTVDGAGVFFESEAGSAQLAECQSSSGAYSSSYAAPTSFPGLWAMGWTKSGTGFLTSEAALGLCAPNVACATDSACDATEALNFVRNPAVAAQHLQGDPAGQMYYVEVLPTVVPSTSGARAELSAVLVGVDFGTSANLSGVQAPVNIGAPVALASQTTSASAGYRGPDHAAAAIIANTAAIAWVEPTTEGADRLRVQRYTMCLPR